MKPTGKTITLYDGGGWFMVLVFFGVPFIVGSVLDYVWNWLVLHLSLKRISPDVRTAQKLVYSLIITVLGLIIDWLYYQITWGKLWPVNLPVRPLFPVKGSNPPLEVASILMPIAALWLANFILARLYLRLRTRSAAILSAVMGFFTAPWLIVFVVLVFQSGLVNL